MTYTVLEDAQDRLLIATSRRTRRGRGVLFATAPLVIYVAFAAVLLALATRDVTLWSQVKEAWRVGAHVAAALALGCFMLGARMRDELSVTSTALTLAKTPALGTARLMRLQPGDLSALAVDPNLRSLGADVLLVAVRKDGTRLPLLEGDPHSDQVRAFAKRIAEITSLPVEAPRFTSGSAAA